MSCHGLRHQTQTLKCPSKARAAPLRRGSIRQPIEARKRSTRRAANEAEPRDTFQKNTAWRSGSGSPPPNYQQDSTTFNAFKRAKEPFEAELLILFGLPTLIILIPWAVKEPAALAIVPLAFLIPGVRDVLLAVLRSTFLGVRRAKKFMREDDGDYYYKNSNRYTRSATGVPYSGNWSARPPPPPPPGSRESFYDLSQDDFTVDPGSEQVDVGSQPEEGDLEESIANKEEEEEEKEEQVGSSEKQTEKVEEAMESPASSQPPRSPPQRRRWVSYNSSAKSAEYEERNAEYDKNNKYRDQSLQSIPASPLAQIRWKDRDQQQNRVMSTSSYDKEDSIEAEEEGESARSRGAFLDAEIETLKGRQGREKRRQARAARSQQRLESIENSISNNGITSVAIRTPPNRLQQQQQQLQLQGRYKNKNGSSYRIRNSFWGNDDSESGEYYYYFGNDEGMNKSTHGADNGRKGRKKIRSAVPWYARPLVALFPFLRNWGGFM